MAFGQRSLIQRRRQLLGARVAMSLALGGQTDERRAPRSGDRDPSPALGDADGEGDGPYREPSPAHKVAPGDSVVSDVGQQIGVHLQRGTARPRLGASGRELAREVRQRGRQKGVEW